MNTGPCGGVGFSQILCQVGDVAPQSRRQCEFGVVGDLQRFDIAREGEGADLERGVEDPVDDDVRRPHLCTLLLLHGLCGRFGGSIRTDRQTARCCRISQCTRLGPF